MVKHAKDFFADRPALGLDCYTGSSSTDGSWRIRISSARADGFRGKYWNEVIIPNAIKPMLKDFGYEISEEFDLKGEDVNPVRSPLDYDRLVVYLNDLSAVSEVSNALREGTAGLVVDPYVENSYRSIHRTKMLSGLILFMHPMPVRKPAGPYSIFSSLIITAFIKFNLKLLGFCLLPFLFFV